MFNIKKYDGASIYSGYASIAFQIEVDLLNNQQNKFEYFMQSHTHLIYENNFLKDQSSINSMNIFQSLLHALIRYSGLYIYDFGLLNNDKKSLIYIATNENEISHLILNKTLETFFENTPLDYDKSSQLLEYCQDQRLRVPNHSISFLLKFAKKIGLHANKIFNGVYLFGLGINSEFYRLTSPQSDSHFGTTISRDKHLSKIFFQKAGVPVADSWLIKTLDDLDSVIKQKPFPCVLKPLDGDNAKGLVLSIIEPEQLKSSVRQALAQENKVVMVEREITGYNVRLLIARGHLIAAVRGVRPYVVGNGKDTIEQLLKIENLHRKLQQDQGARVHLIQYDENYLTQQGLELSSQLEFGQLVYIRGTAHGNLGGGAEIVTDSIHPTIVNDAIRVANRFQLALVGIDYITPDCTLSSNDSGGVFLEVNSFPSLKPLWMLSEEQQLNAAEKIFQNSLEQAKVAIVVSDDIPSFEFLAKRLSVTTENRVIVHGTNLYLIEGGEIKLQRYLKKQGILEYLYFSSSFDEVIFIMSETEIIDDGIPVEIIETYHILVKDVSNRVLKVLERAIKTTPFSKLMAK